MLAQRLGALTTIPHHLVDELTWLPGWIPVAAGEQRRLISEICARVRWILDSAYGSWLDLPLARAQLVVGLDYPRWLSMSRLLRRTVRRVVSGELACNGNRESLRP